MCRCVGSTLIVIVNLLFLPISIALVVVGAFMQWNQKMFINNLVPALVGDLEGEEMKEEIINILTDVISFPSGYGLVIFLIGLFFFILTFCGICGVCYKSKILLGLYAAMLLIISLALLVLTIVWGTRNKFFRDTVEKNLKKIIVKDYTMKNDMSEQKDSFTKFVDALQQAKHCCGATGIKDYNENLSFKDQSYKSPASCCKDMNDKTCWSNPTDQNSYMNTGCVGVLWTEGDRYHKYILYSLVGVLVFNIVFTAIAIYLLRQFTRDELKSS